MFQVAKHQQLITEKRDAQQSVCWGSQMFVAIYMKMLLPLHTTIISKGQSPLSCGARNQTQDLIMSSQFSLSPLHYPHKRETREGGQRDSHRVKNYTEQTPAGWLQESPEYSLHLILICTKLGGMAPEMPLTELSMVPYGSKPSFPSNILHLKIQLVLSGFHLSPAGQRFLGMYSLHLSQQWGTELQDCAGRHCERPSLLTALLREMVARQGLTRTACLWHPAQGSLSFSERKQTLQLTYICLRVQLTPKLSSSSHIRWRILLMTQDLGEQGCLKRSYFTLAIKVRFARLAWTLALAVFFLLLFFPLSQTDWPPHLPQELCCFA